MKVFWCISILDAGLFLKVNLHFRNGRGVTGNGTVGRVTMSAHYDITMDKQRFLFQYTTQNDVVKGQCFR